MVVGCLLLYVAFKIGFVILKIVTMITSFNDLH